MNRTAISKITLIVIASMLITTTACQKAPGELHSTKNGLYFDTIVSVDIYGENSADAAVILDECMNICEKYENLFNKNIKTSDIARINEAGGKPVTVDGDTIELISHALDYCRISNGLFDITIDPVAKLWDFHGKNTTVPDHEALARACSHVDHNNVIIDEADHKITLTDPEASIDVGAAAKGYIADKIAAYLSELKITGAIINMGGDMRLIGSKPGGELFNIGINDPSGSGKCIMSLNLGDMSVATSGTYERCFTSNGTTYHHILDPSNGYSADTDITSVTVITRDALDSDCLCTVAILLGSGKALELIENTPETEAVFVKSDGAVITTSGAGRYIRN